MRRLPAIVRGPTRRLLSSSASDRVSITRRADGVVQVALARPEKMNALDMPMFKAIQAAARELIADSAGVRAVVVHGEGRAFCAGLDVRSVMHPMSAQQNMQELLARPEGEAGNLAQDVGYLWRRVPCPVIAAVHGVCLGGGLQIALGADMRIAHPATKMSIMEASTCTTTPPDPALSRSLPSRPCLPVPAARSLPAGPASACDRSDHACLCGLRQNGVSSQI